MTLSADFKELLEIYPSYLENGTVSSEHRAFQLACIVIPEAINKGARDKDLDYQLRRVRGSTGQGVVAKSPWIRIQRNDLSRTFREHVPGPVILFSTDFESIFLTLELRTGTLTQARLDEMEERAKQLETFLADKLPESLLTDPKFSFGKIDLKANREAHKLAHSYQSGAVCSIQYHKNDIPSDSELIEKMIAFVELETLLAESDMNPEKGTDKIAGWRVLSELTDPEAVIQAIQEFDALGRRYFLRKYNFGGSKTSFVDYAGKLYDVKAIASVAHNIQFPDQEIIDSGHFSTYSAVDVLRELGFDISETSAEDSQLEYDEEELSDRRPSFDFDKLDIPVGSELQYLEDTSITCEVYTNRTVMYDETEISLSGLTNKLKINRGLSPTARYNGALFWLFEGETIDVRRNRIEASKQHDLLAAHNNRDERLILADNMSNAFDGYEYEDIEGRSYEFPNSYINLVVPGSQFIYYRGSLDKSGAKIMPKYFGIGEIAKVTELSDPGTSSKERRFKADISHYFPFNIEVPFKDGERYLEPNAEQIRQDGKRGNIWQRAIRKITTSGFDEIRKKGVRPCWFVGAFQDSGDQTNEFLEAGYWEGQHSPDKRFGALVKEMQVGDRIAIKSAYTQKNNLPFDAQGNTVSCMSIKAIGTITSSPGDGRGVFVDWDDDFEPKQWYFYTYRGMVWKVLPGGWHENRLIDFAFNGAEQDLELFSRVWWKDESFEVDDEEFDDELPDEPEEKFSPPYSIADIVSDGCFIAVERLNEYLEILQTEKNIILQGPPGTGKTWLGKKLGYALMGKKDDERMTRMQFHPNMSYEDFIQGFRPNDKGELELVPGPFLEVIEKAKNDHDNPHVVVIEEINRGNPAQIFGEMLTLLEADKRSVEHALQLGYSAHANGDGIYIPKNLFVIGTMNIADRSLAMVDLALRRRFSFIDLKAEFGEPWRRTLAMQPNFTDEFIRRVETKIKELNEIISRDDDLGEQFQIGHSYFTPGEDSRIDDPDRWLYLIVEYKIRPLLEEYWFDDLSKATELKKQLLLD